MPELSVIESMMDVAETLIRAIDGSEDIYWHTVRYVERGQGLMPQVASFPTVELFVESESTLGTVGYGTLDLYSATMIWHAVGYHQVATDTELTPIRLAQDIRRAIAQDVTLGGYAHDTQWQSTNYAVFSAENGLCMCDVVFSTTYLIDRVDSSGGA